MVRSEALGAGFRVAFGYGGWVLGAGSRNPTPEILPGSEPGQFSNLLALLNRSTDLLQNLRHSVDCRAWMGVPPSLMTSQIHPSVWYRSVNFYRPVSFWQGSRSLDTHLNPKP